MQQIADRIRAEARRGGMSEAALADAASIPRVTLRRRLANPGGFTLAELESLASVLGIDVLALTVGLAS